MSYKVLSLKYRPQAFGDLAGQDHITKTLINAFKRDRVSQAYMLTGPRGVGKTTTARVIAKALNCSNVKNATPCNSCDTCKEIIDGRNLDVLEIDGASNRGIEEIRNLREQIRYAPMNAQYKIFIIDEVHMLTNQAFNALLRTLEEPPSHGKFILATTDIHKVPSTIISRCQRFDFNRINESIISTHLSKITEIEKIKIDDQSLHAISTKADGSMRDALSILDQVIAFSDGSIVYEDVEDIIGIIPHEIFFDYSNALSKKDYPGIYEVLNKIRTSSFQLDDLLEGLDLHFRNYILALTPNGESLMNLNENYKKQFLKTSKRWHVNDILRIVNELAKLRYVIKNSRQPLISFELLTLKLMEMDSSILISDLIKNSSIDNQSVDNKTKQPRTKKMVESVDSKKINNEVAKNYPSEKIPAQNSDNQEDTSPDFIKHNNVDADQEQAEEKLASETNLQDIANVWSDFLVSVNAKRPSIGSTLDHAKPTNIKENKVTITVSDLPEFSVENLNHNKQFIEDLLSKRLNNPIKMTFDWNGDRSVDTPVSNHTSETIQDTAKADQVVEKIIEEFDGEILR